MERGRFDTGIGQSGPNEFVVAAVALVVDSLGLSGEGGIRAADEMFGLIAWAAEMLLNVGVECDNSVIRSRGAS